MNKESVNKVAHNIVERMVTNGFLGEEDDKDIQVTFEWVKQELQASLESDRIESLILYPRCCTHTSTGMSEGYLVGDDYPLQAFLETVLLEDCITAGYKSLEEAYEADFYFYTEWESDIESLREQAYCYDAEGQEYHYCELQRNWSKVV